MALSTRLTLTIVMLVAATAAAVGLLSFRNLESIVVPLEAQHIADSVRLRITGLDRTIRDVEPDLWEMRASAGVRGVVRAVEGGGVDPLDGVSAETWSSRLASMWVARLDAQREYLQYRLLTRDGHEVVRVDRSGPAGTIRVVGAEDLQDKSDRDYVKRMRSLAPDELYFSPIELNEERGKVEEPHKAVLRIGTLVPGSGDEPFGYLIVNFDMGVALAELRRSIEPGGSVYLVDERGNYLVHPDPERQFAYDLGRAGPWSDEFPGVSESLRETGESMATASDPGERRNAVLAAGRRLGGSGPWLAVIQSVPYESLTVAARSFGASTSMVTSIAVLVAVLLSMLIARSFAGPIVGMTEAVTRFGGEKAMPLPVEASGEVGTLSQTLSRMMEEIVEKTQALREISEQRELLAAIVESSEDAIIATNLDGTVTAWNEAAEHQYGFSASEAIGHGIEIVVPEERRVALAASLANIRNGLPMEEIPALLHRDGYQVDVSLRTFAVYDERETIVGVSTIARDMRRQRLAENRFRTTVEACPSGIVSVDEAGVIRLVNVETERMFGYTRAELVGQSVDRLVPGQFRADHAAHRDRYRSAPERRAMGVGRDLFARRKDGSEFPVEIALSPYPAENGGTNVLAVVVDITERKAAERGLAQYSERLKASNDELQQFAYVVSHDLKAPLRGIAAVAEWLAEDFRDVMSEDTKDNIGLMLERTSRMSRLIEGILEYSRVGSEEVVHDALDTAALIEDVIASVVTTDGVSIRVAGTLPNVVYGETQLRQVLQNLIQNALQHMERPDGTIVISCDDEGAFWRFHVRDDGVGIPERHMERIFGLFQTLKSKDEVHSTGVGLSIVKRIVERNGGRVTVASPPSGGADFSFTVPTKDSAPSQVHEAEAAS